MLATNQILHKGRYRIINSFGQDETGGMYEAYDTVSNTNVVLKESVGKLGKIATSTQLAAMNEAFAGHAKSLATIKHESLVSVQDYFSEIGRHYLVLEAVTGFDLTKFLKPNERRPTLLDILSWADQLLSALSYLHQLSPHVFHHDIRPENIKLTSGLKVKLLTAGVATNPASVDTTPIPSQTIGNSASHYRSLEQLWTGLDATSQRVILNSYNEKSAGLLTRAPDARSDLYSVGASLYHVLTGTQPCDALERTIAVLEGKPDPLQKPNDLDQSIPYEISDVFMKAMEIRREKRFDSAMIMRQVLRTAVVRVDERKAGNGKDGEQEAPPRVEVKKADQKAEIDAAGVQLERERSRVEERQRELEAEQTRLEEEQKRIQQRRQELEAETTRQLAEMERLEFEAEQARLRAEEERKRLEKQKLHEEADKERKLIAQKLAELEVEQARKRAEEEQLAIEAQDERNRIEERMHDLENMQERKRQEKERLEQQAEQERQRAAQTLAELEAEQEKRSAEEERLKLEAEEERSRAEERLKELKAEQERIRAEQKRIEAEAIEERTRAEQRLQELSGFDLEGSVSKANDDDQTLLELEPFEKESAEAMDSSYADQTGPMDGDESVSVRAYESTNDFTIHHFHESSAFNWRIPAIAGTVVLLLIVMVGGWTLLSSDAPEPEPSVTAEPVAAQTDQVIQPPASDAQSITDQEQPVESNSTVTIMPTADEPESVNNRVKPAQLNAAQDKPRKPSPSPAKTPPPKKAVTVDDLINDN